VEEPAREVHDRLMRPLRRHLGDAEHILVSADGLLNLLPFGVLRDEQGRYLVERAQLTYLTSGRDLSRLATAGPKRGAPVVIADPDFGAPRGSGRASSAAGIPSMSTSRAALRFEPLPQTAVEARAVKAALHLDDDQVLTGRAATEPALRRLTGPRILHLATHGFFLADQPRDPGFPASAAPGRNAPSASAATNPLLRSGLALSGANEAGSGDDDGILTALELAGLDLAGTELAVLSACETGVGQVQSGDGVYGLRRALVLAGVRTQVVSLWKVDDAATKDLMTDYYARLGGGAGRSAGLREAQLAMLDDPARSHPYYWAAFVVIGDGTPLAR
jgi:CHAT domain-containing protein